MLPIGIFRFVSQWRNKTGMFHRTYCNPWEAGKIGKEWVIEEQVTNHTFHDIHQWSHISFLDDAAVFAIFHGVHTIHNLLDLWQLQVLHEVIVKDGLLYEILWPKAREGGVTDMYDQPFIILKAQWSYAVFWHTKKWIFLKGLTKRHHDSRKRTRNFPLSKLSSSKWPTHKQQACSFNLFYNVLMYKDCGKNEWMHIKLKCIIWSKNRCKLSLQNHKRNNFHSIYYKRKFTIFVMNHLLGFMFIICSLLYTILLLLMPLWYGCSRHSLAGVF